MVKCSTCGHKMKFVGVLTRKELIEELSKTDPKRIIYHDNGTIEIINEEEVD